MKVLLILAALAALTAARDSCNCNCDCDERCRHIPVYIYEKRVPVPVPIRETIPTPIAMPVPTVTTKVVVPKAVVPALGGIGPGFAPMMSGGWIKK